MFYISYKYYTSIYIYIYISISIYIYILHIIYIDIVCMFGFMDIHSILDGLHVPRFP